MAFRVGNYAQQSLILNQTLKTRQPSMSARTSFRPARLAAAISRSPATRSGW